MGKTGYKLNQWIFLAVFTIFFLTVATMVLCILMLVAVDDECSAAVVVYTDDGKSSNSEIYPCSSNPCKNGGQCFTTQVKENCVCPLAYTGRICSVPAHIMVKLHSQRPCQSNISCPVSSIVINGSQIDVTDPGLTFVILNATTGKQMISQHFETRPDQTTWNNITEFLTFLPIEVIILMVYVPSGSSYLHHAIPILALTLNNQLPTNISQVSSWVLAGYKGVLGVSWTTSRKSSLDMGSANVTLSIPIVGVGQDCRQCNPMSCLKIVDGFVCECRFGYTGATCSQELVEQCRDGQVRCYNGGRCIYTDCHPCPSGYNGTFCEEHRKMNVSLLARSPNSVGMDNNISLITANGTVYKQDYLGMTFVILSAITGEMYALQHFKSDVDTNYTTNDSAILSFVNSLPNEVYALSVMATNRSSHALVRQILMGRHSEDSIIPANNTEILSWALVMYNGVVNISRPIISVVTSSDRNAVINTSVPIIGIGNKCQHCYNCFNQQSTPYVCQCQPGYTGRTCKEISGCDVLKPCMNNGTCIDGVHGSYTCSCRSGFKGTNCELVGFV